MFNALVIFGAKYLWLLSPILALAYFWIQSRAKKKEFALFLFIVFPLVYIVAKGVGFLYYNPRPFVVGDFIPLVSHASDNGFPSDHTLILATLAAIVIFYNRLGGILLFLFALTVGVFRVFAGVHHVVDIVGSIGIAIIGALVTYYLILPLVLNILRKLSLRKGNTRLPISE